MCTLFFSCWDKLRCEGAPGQEQHSGGGREGREDHIVPLDVEQKMVCGVGDLLGTCSRCSSRNRFLCAGGSSLPECETLARALSGWSCDH